MEVAKYWVIQDQNGHFYRMTSYGQWLFDENFSKAKHFTSKGRAEARMKQITGWAEAIKATMTVRSVTVTLD